MIKHILSSYLLFSVSTTALVSAEANTSVVDMSQLLQIEQLVEQISDRQVVFVGETHDRYDHHLNQLEIIRQLHQRHDRLAIGLEFFQQPFQSVLDDYVAGSIDEATMLERTEYYDRWRFDYRLYQPILRYARDNGIPLLALNIEREVTDQVSRNGLDGLSDELKQGLPDKVDESDQAYRQRLEEIFLQHPHASQQAFERFHQVQLLWDETMAENAADWLRDNPEGHMVILAGAGHVIYGSGIPQRLQRRLPVKMATVINSDAANGLDPSLADFVILSTPQSLPASGKMGVILDTQVSPPRITGFSDTSDARTAGMRKKDQIISIDGQPISSFGDIRIALMNKTVGERVTIEVERKKLFSGSKQLSFNVKLE
ncbi:MAG: ChaN family lipoprotein [Gammaproteobacteria bacterium]|nr:ChaN family lipoprotein [Gammaproteobacteria bacterium]